MYSESRQEYFQKKVYRKQAHAVLVCTASCLPANMHLKWYPPILPPL